MDDEMKQLHQQMLASNDKLDQLEMEKSSMEMELRRLEALHADKERRCQIIVKDFEYGKERETVLRVDRSVIPRIAPLIWDRPLDHAGEFSWR